MWLVARVFSGNDDDLYYVLAFLSTKVAAKILALINPTLNCQVVDIQRVPIINDNLYRDEIISLCKEAIELSKIDWNLFEYSWWYTKNCLIKYPNISEGYYSIKNDINSRFDRLKEIEKRINQIFIEIYNISDELEINTKDITVHRVFDDSSQINEAFGNNYAITKKDVICDFVHYLIGVELGRYSLDIDGLAYAGGKWNKDNYKTYQPDDDGIVPIYMDLGMEDSLTTRIIKLIKKIYGEGTYRENIDFIADAIGKNNNESSEETLNRYLNNDFILNHIQKFKTKSSGMRPIYWMFYSGKNNAFKCLVYLHRYDKNTLAKINSKYFLNESARLNNEVNETRLLLDKAEGREKIKLDKQMKTLLAKQKEMIEYGQVLDHMANQYIDIDLDDGVKANYAKFQGIEVVNDNGIKIKKDLLIPIK